MVLIFKPFIWFSSMLTRLVASPQRGPSATEVDIRAITSLSRQTGRIQQYEENAIRNILSLDVKHVREIMTPRKATVSSGMDRIIEINSKTMKKGLSRPMETIEPGR